MPCDDCSRTESCPPCPSEEEPKGSASSSTERPFCEKKGRHCLTHPYGWPNVDGKCCVCGITREELADGRDKPDLQCTCGCRRSQHMGKPEGCLKHGLHSFVCDHSRCGWKPREDKPTTVLFERYEPPMTPEEEEQAPEDERPPLHPDDDHTHRPKYFGPNAGTRCVDCNMPMPPQPERRPLYAVAYSVGGHLYEVAVSGDASVRAVDGALVITHAMGPVAGIVQTAPLPSGGQG